MNGNTPQTRFESTYKRPVGGLVRAPGRVNLIGEHTDYNDGFVLPIAIERCTLAAWAPRDDRKVSFISRQAPDEPAQLDLDELIVPGQPAWANYCRGVTAGLIERGLELRGVDILFDSDVPLGAGLSTSAALEVATAMALLAAADKSGQVPLRELALLCQKAEHEYANAPCGIMDQSICIMGQAGRALLLDCRDGQTRQIHFDDPRTVLLVADTQVKHAISDGGYAARRSQCESATEKLGVKALRDVDRATLSAAAEAGALSDLELQRARHVVGEIDRTVQAADALESNNTSRFGNLMYESHESLRDDYEVSCEELDAIVAAARSCEGVWGARMTGGGFGGCAIVLVEADQAPAVTDAIQQAFAAKFGRKCPVFATRAADGAGLV